MKVVKTAVLVGVLVVCLSSTALASWWNPVTWRVFSKQTQKLNIKPIVSTSSESISLNDNLLSCNGSKYKTCPNGQTFTCPTDGKDAFCEKNKVQEIKTPKIKESSSLPIKVENKRDSIDKNKTTLSVSSDINDYNNQTLKIIDLGIESVNSDSNIYIELSKRVQTRIKVEQDLLNNITPYYDSSKTEGENEFNDIIKKTITVVGKEIEYLENEIVLNSQAVNLKQPILDHLNNQREYVRNSKVDKKYLEDTSLDIQKMEKLLSDNTLAKVSKYNYLITSIDDFKDKKQADIDWLINDTKNNSLRQENDRLKSEATYRMINEQAKLTEELMKKSESSSKNYYCESNYLGVQGAYSISCH